MVRAVVGGGERDFSDHTSEERWLIKQNGVLKKKLALQVSL